MKKDSLSKRTFSLDFKHQVLIDYYRSGSTKYFLEKKAFLLNYVIFLI